MEQVVHPLWECQRKLECALEKHMKQAEVDRTVFAIAIHSQGDNLTKMAEGQSQLVAGTDRSRGPTVSRAMVQLQKYVPGQVPVAFFLNFERAARASSWPSERWPIYLALLFTGEAQVAYQIVNRVGTTGCGEVKEFIMDRLGIDQATHRLKFRKERGTPGDTPKTLFDRITDTADRWLKPLESTKQEIMEKIYLEQYLEALPFQMQKWLLQHAGLTLDHAVEMATSLVCAQSRGYSPDPEKISKPFPLSSHKNEKKPNKTINETSNVRLGNLNLW
ncbi:hypothetical protein NDU88_001518 [Pleurodeles waltl]|uniref:SCAN box domain-containing protein n=1 Tax=Pleurodeles waltl TaxID=8319 RepID=A0AAV7NCU1_PLEWA|nr:hypothetical protein NDU88_001518 [Pleurodeles waltl]